VHIYIGFETLKAKCTRYGICSQATFKNARTMFFSKLGRTDNNFRSDSKKIPGGDKMFAGVMPRPDLTPPISLWGDFNVPLLLAIFPNDSFIVFENGFYILRLFAIFITYLQITSGN
jgi:hypothetical protein